MVLSYLEAGRSGDTHTEQQRYDYIRNVVKTVNRTGRVEVEVHGIQNLPEKNGFILFQITRACLMFWPLWRVVPIQLGIVVKKEASNIILIKQVIAAMHGMAIDRQDVKASLKVITKMTEDVKQGRNYVIFAEGTRSREGNHLLSLKEEPSRAR